MGLPVAGRIAHRISIHALLAESDMNWLRTAGVEDDISIHALLAESDIQAATLNRYHFDFYPRSPCGERHSPKVLFMISSLFLSTLSLRRATARGASNQPEQQISIHALLAESDANWFDLWGWRDISIHALLAESDRKSAQNSGALLRI